MNSNKIPKLSDPQLLLKTQMSARESWRMLEIIAEFVNVTERLAEVQPAVTVFGSARHALASVLRARRGGGAPALGRRLLRHLGGGPGIAGGQQGRLRGPSHSVA